MSGSMADFLFNYFPELKLMMLVTNGFDPNRANAIARRANPFDKREYYDYMKYYEDAMSGLAPPPGVNELGQFHLPDNNYNGDTYKTWGHPWYSEGLEPLKPEEQKFWEMWMKSLERANTYQP